jgi:hypothetical protein
VKKSDGGGNEIFVMMLVEAVEWLLEVEDD